MLIFLQASSLHTACKLKASSQRTYYVNSPFTLHLISPAQYCTALCNIRPFVGSTSTMQFKFTLEAAMHHNVPLLADQLNAAEEAAVTK